jgi:hypothetical protein
VRKVLPRSKEKKEEDEKATSEAEKNGSEKAKMYMKSTTLFDDISSLEEAIATADHHVKRFFAMMGKGNNLSWKVLLKDAPWRSRPASNGQLQTLRKQLRTAIPVIRPSTTASKEELVSEGLDELLGFDDDDDGVGDYVDGDGSGSGRRSGEKEPVVTIRGRAVPISELTKGQAANEISRLKNGAKANMAKLEKSLAKLEMEERKKREKMDEGSAAEARMWDGITRSSGGSLWR